MYVLLFSSRINNFSIQSFQIEGIHIIYVTTLTDLQCYSITRFFLAVIQSPLDLDQDPVLHPIFGSERFSHIAAQALCLLLELACTPKQELQ